MKQLQRRPTGSTPGYQQSASRNALNLRRNMAFKEDIYWCIGMYNSASTWLYNAVYNVVAMKWQPVRPLGRFCYYRMQFQDALQVPGPVVIKSHDIPKNAVNYIRRCANHIFVSVRDPRDCVASLIRYHNEGFESALSRVEASARLCRAASLAMNATTFIYESRFFEASETLTRIGKAARYYLAPEQTDSIMEALTREKVEEFIRNLTNLPWWRLGVINGDIFDTETHWHLHHASRDGESGNWRQVLTSPQIRQVEGRLSTWMTQFHYSPFVQEK